MPRRVVLSSCSGGGKSTLLAELARRGHAVRPEAGRRVVEAETAAAGDALPWTDMARFMERLLDLAAAQHGAPEAGASGGAARTTVFFDRSVVDAVAWFQRTGIPLPARHAGVDERLRYHPLVFLVPPWPEIYVQDGARRHDLGAAQAEYAALLESWPATGYEVAVIPRAPVAERADWVLARLAP